jgi:hypothetical protein
MLDIANPDNVKSSLVTDSHRMDAKAPEIISCS